jgi:hypothetical protein
MHNYFLIEHSYSQSVIYNFKSELKIWKHYSVVKIITVMIVIYLSMMKFFTIINAIIVINVTILILLFLKNRARIYF